MVKVVNYISLMVMAGGISLLVKCFSHVGAGSTWYLEGMRCGAILAAAGLISLAINAKNPS